MRIDYVCRTTDPAILLPVMKFNVARPRSVDAEKGTMTVVLTSEHLDRYGEVVLTGGVELKDYNGVVLYDHGHDTIRGRLPVARITDIRPDKLEDDTPALLGDVQFYRPGSGITDSLPAHLADMYAQGFMSGVSIGFRPLPGGIKFAPYGAAGKSADEDEGDEKPPEVLHYTHWELLELSLVAVPANPHAGALSANTDSYTDETIDPPAQAKDADADSDDPTGKEPDISQEPRDVITLLTLARNSKAGGLNA